MALCFTFFRLSQAKLLQGAESYDLNLIILSFHVKKEQNITLSYLRLTSK